MCQYVMYMVDKRIPLFNYCENIIVHINSQMRKKESFSTESSQDLSADSLNLTDEGICQ